MNVLLLLLFCFVLMDQATASASTISANMNSIPMLNGTNFKDWKENVMIVLGCMDLDLVLRVGQPAALTDKSSPEEKRDFERRDRSNRMSLMITKQGIPKAFSGAVFDKVTTAKEFIEEIEKRFAKNVKAETSTLLADLISKRYKGKGNIREYITEMSHLASKLKALKLELSEDLLVHLVLISLSAQFGQFKVSYNCQKEKWSLNEIISYCVQEEERLKQARTESAQMADTSMDKNKRRKKDKEAAGSSAQKKQQKDQDKEFGCYFCHTPGHMKKDCAKYHAWRAKKDTLLNLVCSEVNLVSVPRHTWWVDSGGTTHISVSMQGCLSCRKPSDSSKYIFVGDGKSAEVEAIGTFRLLLKIGF